MNFIALKTFALIIIVKSKNLYTIVKYLTTFNSNSSDTALKSCFKGVTFYCMELNLESFTQQWDIRSYYLILISTPYLQPLMKKQQQRVLDRQMKNKAIL